MASPPAVLACFFLTMVAGCSAPAETVTETTTTRSTTAQTALPPIGTPRFDHPILLHAEADYPFEEPLAVRGPNGTVYVAAPIVEMTLARSVDGGRTFVSLQAKGLRGGDDAGLAADGDALWWAGLEPGDPMTVVVQRSHDGGASFVAVANFTGELHRPWLAVRGGAIVLAWVDRAGEEPDQVLVAASQDGGATWTAPRQVSEGFGLPGNVVASIVPGTFYVPFSDRLGGTGTNKVAATRDSGSTWEVYEATSAPGILPSLAEDAAGALYLVYDAAEHVLDTASLPANGVPFGQGRMGTFLALSRDGGATWTAPTRIGAGDAHAVLPTVVAGAPGRIAVAYYASLASPSRNVPSEWRATLAVSGDGGRTFHVAAATTEPAHVGLLCNQCGPAGTPAQDSSRLDHLGLAAADDGIVVAWLRDADDPVAEAQQGTVLRRPVEVMASRANVVLG